jgi:diguanylate cyclase (GGDEF)-like protein
MNWAAARRGVSWVVPEGLILAAAVAALRVPALRDPVEEFARFYPYVVFGLGLLLALRFQRSRLVFALLLLALTWWGLDRAPAGPAGEFLFQAAAALLPLNLAAVTLMTERGTLTRTGLVRLAALAAQVALLVAAARFAPGRAAAIAGYAFLPPAWLGWTPLAHIPIAAFGAAAALIVVAIVFQASPTGRAFLWALVAVFLGLHSQHSAVAGTIYLSTAGLVLVVAVVEASYLMAYHDGLTGLPGRRALNETLQRLEGRYTVAMVDVDHFKRLNDSHGHDVGDQVLRMIASQLSKVSGGGRAFRYGGEEFAVIFPRGVAECLPDLEVLRQAIEQAKFTLRRRLRPRRKPTAPKTGSTGRHAPQIAVTVSIGAAEPNGRHPTPDEVVQAADRALYRAKEAGRNRVKT